MEEKTLSGLLEEDKEMLLENISRDRTPEAAQATVEKELDRILNRYSEEAGGEEETLLVQAILQTARNTLPLLGAVGEVREWQLSAKGGEKKRGVRPLGLILALAGLALVLGAFLVLLKNSSAALTLGALLPTVLGAALLAAGGALSRRKKGESRSPEAEKKQEFLVDAAQIYRTLRGTLLVADRRVQELREERKIADTQRAAREGGMNGEETELFASLLEAAYARRGSDDDAEEIIGSIRYFLHQRNVETVDYTKEKESWFELLPARRSATVRPALLYDGRLIKKGLASSAEG